MKDHNYWKNYVYEIDIKEIENNLKKTTFKSRGLKLSLKYFEKDKNAPNILYSPGTGYYALPHVELLYYMYRRGYNTFGIDFQGHGDSEGGRGDFTINELVENCNDAVKYISSNFNNRIGAFGNSLGGFVTFYLGLAQGPVKSIVCQNAAVLTEKKFQDEVAEKIGKLLPLGKLLVKLFPKGRIPIKLYVDHDGFRETKREKEELEKYIKDPDIIKKYTLRAVLSQISTPPPKPIEELKIPIMLLVPTRDKLLSVSYMKDLYNRFSSAKKKFVKIDGGHEWIISYPKKAAKIICDWFDETL